MANVDLNSSSPQKLDNSTSTYHRTAAITQSQKHNDSNAMQKLKSDRNDRNKIKRTLIQDYVT